MVCLMYYPAKVLDYSNDPTMSKRFWHEKHQPKNCNVLKLFLVKHFHDTLNGWLKTLRKHGVMFSLGSGMNITHTFSILWPCFHQKNSKHQEIFCHLILENITQTIQIAI